MELTWEQKRDVVRVKWPDALCKKSSMRKFYIYSFTKAESDKNAFLRGVISDPMKGFDTRREAWESAYQCECATAPSDAAAPVFQNQGKSEISESAMSQVETSDAARLARLDQLELTSHASRIVRHLLGETANITTRQFIFIEYSLREYAQTQAAPTPAEEPSVAQRCGATSGTYACNLPLGHAGNHYEMRAHSNVQWAHDDRVPAPAPQPTESATRERYYLSSDTVERFTKRSLSESITDADELSDIRMMALELLERMDTPAIPAPAATEGEPVTKRNQLEGAEDELPLSEGAALIWTTMHEMSGPAATSEESAMAGSIWAKTYANDFGSFQNGAIRAVAKLLSELRETRAKLREAEAAARDNYKWGADKRGRLITAEAELAALKSAQSAICGAIDDGAVCVKQKGHADYHGTTNDDVRTAKTGKYWWDVLPEHRRGFVEAKEPETTPPSTEAPLSDESAAASPEPITVPSQQNGWCVHCKLPINGGFIGCTCYLLVKRPIDSISYTHLVSPFSSPVPSRGAEELPDYGIYASMAGYEREPVNSPQPLTEAEVKANLTQGLVSRIGELRELLMRVHFLAENSIEDYESSPLWKKVTSSIERDRK